MFRSVPYRRNNYYYSRKGQVIQRRTPHVVSRTYTISDLHKFAQMTNAQGITIPNPDYNPHPVPPSPPKPEEEEEEQPEPIINFPIENLLISQSPYLDLKVISYKQCFLTPYLTKYNEPIQQGTVQQVFVVIEDPSQFNRPHLFVCIFEDFNFVTGEGYFSQFGCQILDSYENLTDKPPEEVFPLMLTYSFKTPFNVGYILDDPDPNNYDKLISSHQLKIEWAGVYQSTPDTKSVRTKTINATTSTQITKELTSTHVPKIYNVQTIRWQSLEQMVYSFYDDIETRGMTFKD